MKKLIKTMPIVAIAALLMAGAFLFTGCEKEKKTSDDTTNSISNNGNAHSDSIQGIIIGSEMCSNDIVGYLIAAIKPNFIGKTLLLDELSYSNVVKTYSIPNNSPNIGDTVIGLFQFKPDSLNTRACPSLYPIYDVPEIIIDFSN